MARLVAAKCDTFHPRRALITAVAKKYLNVLSELIKKSNPAAITEALTFAAVHDHKDSLEILLAGRNANLVEKILMRVAPDAQPDVVKLLLGRCDPAGHAGIFTNAAGLGFVGLVVLLLEEMNQRTIRCALISAATNGQAAGVVQLVDKSDPFSIVCAFEMAAVNGHVEVVEVLRDRCDAETICFGMTSGRPDVVHLLRNKQSRRE
ncbi:hypothetical protein PHYPSEUDO_011109 [Phytophthora pseudosyringae]|uniref:Ankyrin repeat protein n=1 Tax=Phytophthora pseudosyringae TaxID=221518 RepID=A0A8T1W772_9STRA|nr:hypothetical protein PHYPSEUDO_011109 [Phytophthora pseudosyringae]